MFERFTLRGFALAIASVVLAYLPCAPSQAWAGQPPVRGLTAIPREEGHFSWWFVSSPVYNDIHVRAEGDSVIVLKAPPIFDARCHLEDGELLGLVRLRRQTLRDDEDWGRVRLLRARWRAPDKLKVTWTLPTTGKVSFQETWYDVGEWREVEIAPDSLPKLGEYVLVDKQPESIQRAPLSYPSEALEKRIDGMVLVFALVGRDGLVKDTFTAVSVPGLDEASVTWVRQGRYEPALRNGLPVAVWVPVPVKFSLH